MNYRLKGPTGGAGCPVLSGLASASTPAHPGSQALFHLPSCPDRVVPPPLPLLPVFNGFKRRWKRSLVSAGRIPNVQLKKNLLFAFFQFSPMRRDPMLPPSLQNPGSTEAVWSALLSSE